MENTMENAMESGSHVRSTYRASVKVEGFEVKGFGLRGFRVKS